MTADTSNEELGKDWLYRQGQWERIDGPDADIPNEAGDWFEWMHYDQQAAEVHGIEPHYVVSIYHPKLGPNLERPHYPYYGEMEIRGRTERFYIADFPSYLQLVPQLIDQVQNALHLAQFVKQLTETERT